MTGSLLASWLVIGLIIGIVAVVALGAIICAVVCSSLIKKNAAAREKNELKSAEPQDENSEPEAEPEREEKPEESVHSEEPVEAPCEEPEQESVVAPVSEEETFVASAREEPAPLPVSDEQSEEEDEQDDGDEEEEPVGKIMFTSANRLVEVRYDKSFTARLIQTSDKNKEYYSQLKNELLRYRRVKSRVSWKQESFRKGRELKAKMEIRGKTLCLYLALDPAKFEDSKYIVEDASDVKRNVDVPCKYRIKNDRRLRYAKELIAMVFEGTDAVYRETEPVDFAAEFPYEETQPLIGRELIKLIRVRDDGTEEPFDASAAEEVVVPAKHEVTAEEATREMRDEVALHLVRESGNVSVRGKQTIVNVDTLGEYFNEGETVTFEDMKERIPFLNRSATYIKVLARGRLSKALVVEADDFSLDAIKMIVLAGGTVYRKRSE